MLRGFVEVGKLGINDQVCMHSLVKEGFLCLLSFSEEILQPLEVLTPHISSNTLSSQDLVEIQYTDR